MTKYRYIFLLCLFSPVFLLAQTTYLVSGKVLSVDSSLLINCTIHAGAISVNSDSLGRFQLRVPKTANKVSITYPGFISQHITVVPGRDTVLQLFLKTDIELGAAVITSTKSTKAAEHNTDGSILIGRQGLSSLPAFVGENDPIRAVQMQPGVQSGSEGSRGIFVRGGGPDQTLLLVDGAPVYNASHIYGFISVVNGDAVESIEVYKDRYPAQYGGRLAAVINLNMQQGDTEKIKGSFTLGVLTSHLHLEGPITKNKKLTFSVSARGCYAGLVTAPLSERQFAAAGYSGSIKYYFADVNAKLAYRISAKTSVELNFFTSNDFYSFKKATKDTSQGVTQVTGLKQSIQWSNYVASARVLQTVNQHWEITHQLYFTRYKILNSDYNSDAETTVPGSNTDFTSSYNFNTTAYINDFGWHSDAVYSSRRNTVSTGAGISARMFKTNQGDYDIDNSLSGHLVYKLSGNLQPSVDAFVYAEDEFKVSRRVTITAGLHARSYTSQPKTFLSLLPRGSVLYNPVGKLYLRASVAGLTQNAHLLTTASSNILNDYWVPATAVARPESGWNFSGGITQKLPLGFEWSVDGFYRMTKNLIDYKESIPNISVYKPWESQIITGGLGRSYGAEFYVARTYGRVTGSIAYTLAWSDRKFSGVNNDEYFSYKYDRRHNIAAQVVVNLTRHIEVGAAWVYGSGNMITLPYLTYQSFKGVVGYNQQIEAGQQGLSSQLINVYSGKNNYRLPAYHHLDISFTYRKQVKKLEHAFNLSIYNVYNHFNQFMIYPDYKINADGTRSIIYKQISLFPIIPSFSYTIKF